ncbi:MAG: isopentenyl-diphosphate Delta-isomerase [Acidimicrobiia bacterium]
MSTGEEVTSPTDRDLVVLVDPEDRDVGVEHKIIAHSGPGLLHRAVSVCLFDTTGAVLLQRRAPTKYHFGGLWSNACCTHPMPGEAPAEAAARRVREELEVASPDLVPCGSFTYRADDPQSAFAEWELDHVFAGVLTDDPEPDPAEIAELRWFDCDAADLAPFCGAMFTPWLAAVLRTALPRVDPSAG